MENLKIQDSTPWMNGYYSSSDTKFVIHYVQGENCTSEPICGKPTKESAVCKGTWKYGDFGEALPDVVEKTGKKRYNVEMTLYGGFMKLFAVVSDEGKTVTYYSKLTNNIICYEWKSKEEMLALKDTGDSVNELPSHYKIQPDYKGKFLWISGPPGVGKSTSGLFLSKTSGYVYYEGDLFAGQLNPYVPPGEDVMAGFFKQNFLKGVSQERIDSVENSHTDFMAMIGGDNYDSDVIKRFYHEMCKDILKERNRLGGDWAIVHAVPTKQFRDYCREQLGSDLIFVVLNMSKEVQSARVVKRTADLDKVNDMLMKAHSTYEPASENESNAVNIYITKEMTRDDVVQNILQKVQIK